MHNSASGNGRQLGCGSLAVARWWRQLGGGGGSLAAAARRWWRKWRQRAVMVEATVAVTAAWQPRRKRCGADSARWWRLRKQLGSSS